MNSNKEIKKDTEGLTTTKSIKKNIKNAYRVFKDLHKDGSLMLDNVKRFVSEKVRSYDKDD